MRRAASTFFIGLLLTFCALPIAYAGVCDVAWDGAKLASAIAGQPGYLRIPLRDKQQNTTEVTVDQIQAFAESKDRISGAAGLSPSFIICNSSAPNAFATSGKNGDVVGVTIGMLRLVDGDRDMAGAVMGHELAHHTKRHRATAATRDALIGLAGLVLGVVIDAKAQRRTGFSSGLGVDLAAVGGALVSRKFDRDQEREADEVGFNYMVASGFNPTGSIRLAARMIAMGSGGAGLFFDSHPGWDERSDRFKSMIAASPEAQRLASAAPAVGTTTSKQSSGSVSSIALLPTYETTDAEQSYTDGLAALRARDIANGVRELRSAAEAGYAPAQAIVGHLYARGIGGVQRDDAQATYYYRLAADQDDANGQANLGAMYATGRGGLQKDEAEAVRLFRLAADQGNAGGQASLGAMYDGGRGGLPRDEVEAVRLYRLAADQEDAMGQSNLGSAYARGLGRLQKDEVEAVHLYRLAADKGNPRAQSNLGHMYLSGGGGLSKDEVEAVRLFRLSASQGDTLGQINLGVMFETGRGRLTRNIEEAVSWYQRAAAQGDARAVANLKRLGRL